jgi:hypothetical protein
MGMVKALRQPSDTKNPADENSGSGKQQRQENGDR